MEAKDIKPGVKVRRVKHTPTTIHGCTIGFETKIIRPKENGIGFWYKDEYGDSSTTSHPQDWELVQTDGPVRTVTRTVTETTIKPGTYARITVNDEGKAGMVGIWLNSGHYFSPSELRAAAAVLLELAGALDNGE